MLGGAELLFDGVREHLVTLPGQSEPSSPRGVVANYLFAVYHFHQHRNTEPVHIPPMCMPLHTTKGLSPWQWGFHDNPSTKGDHLREFEEGDGMGAAADLGGPSSRPGDMKQLLAWIRGNLLKERPELFVQGDTVRPGILVLINDADWELMGELTYQLQDQDNVVFISTLHGG
ncbi:hypothetical protein Z043_108039 [Scleropages formosus]|uniref:Ubiquitin-related modifier 1 n=1 Tax=Scleropages formosus TaxID=113540 RepID=A0A0P7VCK0_SCLFO|nr:hypothetical protein Z043_108039 [Scleropages formosus]